MQPLDTAVFGPLKTHYRESCHNFIQKNPGKVITKYQSEAWLKTMVPSAIINGFKTCGIYPFNRKAVLDHDPCSIENSRGDPDTSKESLQDERLLNDGGTDLNVCCTNEEKLRFTKRYEEGYDLYDTRYLLWLKQNHPDSVPGNLSPNELDTHTHKDLDLTTPQPQDSIADYFSHVQPIDPLTS